MAFVQFIHNTYVKASLYKNDLSFLSHQLIGYSANVYYQSGVSFFQSSPEDMFIGFREEGKERRREKQTETKIETERRERQKEASKG